MILNSPTALSGRFFISLLEGGTMPESLIELLPKIVAEGKKEVKIRDNLKFLRSASVKNMGEADV